MRLRRKSTEHELPAAGTTPGATPEPPGGDQETADDAPPAPAPKLLKRRRQEPARDRRIMLRLSDDEYAAIVEAAVDHGRTPTGYAADAAVRAARISNRGGLPEGAAPTATTPVGAMREALVELMQARVQVRKVGTNLNQAVLVLNATGDVPTSLDGAVANADRVIAELDARANELARRIRAAGG